MLVMIGLAQHEIGADDADLGAVEHQLEMLLLDVLAARFKAMVGQHRGAGRVAIERVF